MRETLLGKPDGSVVVIDEIQQLPIVIGDAELAIEVKSASEIVGRHLKGLLSFKEEFPDARCIVVSLDKMERTTASGVEILLANNFLRKMWGGELV